VVGALFEGLAAKVDGCTLGAASRSKEYLAVAIVSLVIAELVDIAPQGAGDDLADRVLAHCLSRLSDPGLTVESVARAHGVSVRYLPGSAGNASSGCAATSSTSRSAHAPPPPSPPGGASPTPTT
jgi:hypothetical protein